MLTEFELRMLKEFGSTGICMDATHGTNICTIFK